MTTISAGAATGLLVALMVVATTDDGSVNRQAQSSPGADQNPSGLLRLLDKKSGAAASLR